ncbi:HpcH/HpaI aldolase/citrate lyase family protein [uncultured Psychrobacter sp.]|jgi:citrate lyase beta subunit|uniref:HpcH/HpaI aldolase/citrate lyase family protein n=2 Tax=uncultured Psychrobacter sp. TaxID=259303 RepID=UPI000C5E9203|nr:HpcH/HpaI aldolase/citrate lyase family protein [uncultured Psychrobacter sp.]MAE39659.1 citrate lyase subunit beta-like protein [Psychrobacter sp.]|tara:strand:- start:367 stop:1431 length:1065 start_codon:yes stop_codon:yes gene_type:complete
MPDNSNNESNLYNYTQSYEHLITERHALLKPHTHHPYQLGASLYMPATRQDIWQVIKRDKLPTINSIIICVEDAVSHDDVELALQRLQELLNTWAAHIDSINDPSTPQNNKQEQPTRPLVFVRPRNPMMLQKLAHYKHIELLDGFVMPKVDMCSLSNWRMACQNLSTDQLLMPTLETAALFNPHHNQELAIGFKEAFSQPVFALRIGGNDLFAALRLRRPKNSIVYDTPIGTLAYQLLGCFVPHGFYLTAPVFEYLDQPTLFMQELTRDVSLGLVGKTVIHPNQIALVQQAYCVPASTLDEAQAILHSEAKAVFKYNNTMLEPATHRAWATEIINRAKVFGTINNDNTEYSSRL